MAGSGDLFSQMRTLDEAVRLRRARVLVGDPDAASRSPRTP
jgi:hypothetical protein